MTIRRITVFLAVCILISFAFCGCRKNESVDDGVMNTTQTKQEDNVTDHVSKDDENYGDIAISTPYVDLHYPENWLNYLKTEKNFDEENNVTFFASLDEKKDVELFTVHFNEDGEISLGVLNLEDERVYIAFSYAELKFDDTWTQNDIDVVCAMQEQINYIIENLKEEPGFIGEE